jgi:hypothetical protein
MPGDNPMRLVKILFLVTLLVLPTTWAVSKGKSKQILPAYVLTARTVSVIVDPYAGISMDDPRANQIAQKDVETALSNWGRFEPLIGQSTADLIIVVHKGRNRLVDETIPDPRQNNRAGVINPTNDGIYMGGQRGQQPQNSPNANPPISAPSQTEIGDTDDSFIVYQGNVENPLASPPAWRFTARDCLRSHNVPAVDEFRRAVDDAEKAAASKKP